MLTIPPKRMAFEAARAAEIQAADQAMVRERIYWYFAAIGCVLAGTGMTFVALHVTTDLQATIWLASGTLLGEIGPLVILVTALHREES